jgi:hypothetical protein
MSARHAASSRDTGKEFPIEKSDAGMRRKARLTLAVVSLKVGEALTQACLRNQLPLHEEAPDRLPRFPLLPEDRGNQLLPGNNLRVVKVFPRAQRPARSAVRGVDARRRNRPVRPTASKTAVDSRQNQYRSAAPEAKDALQPPGGEAVRPGAEPGTGGERL